MNEWIYRLARVLAWCGACVLVAMALLSVASIVGRAFSFAGLGPVRGDFELVEAGTALAVFCFLPWCHLRHGHAVVDLFWHAMPTALRHVLALASDALMLALWLLLTWRMAIATLEYRATGETTFILLMPVWWAYAAAWVPAALGCLVYLQRVLETAGLAQPPARYAAAGGASH